MTAICLNMSVNNEDYNNAKHTSMVKALQCL